MNKKDWQTHLFILSSLFVLSLVFAYLNNEKVQTETKLKHPEFSFLNLNDSLDLALLRNTLAEFYSVSQSNKIIAEVRADQEKRQSAFARNYRPLNFSLLYDLLKRWLFFAMVFFFSWFFLLFIAERLAVYKFLKSQKKYQLKIIRSYKLFLRSKKKQQILLLLLRNSSIHFWRKLKMLFVFSPAFILAYIFKAEFELFPALSFVFLIIFSNGTVFILAQRYLAIIDFENRQGYMETATVKELPKLQIAQMSFLGFLRSYSELLERETTFQHLYLNAKKKMLQAGKSFVLFFISMMIIVEMALNAQSYFAYYLLKMLLLGNNHIVLFQILLLYLLIVLSEYFMTLRLARHERRGL